MSSSDCVNLSFLPRLSERCAPRHTHSFGELYWHHPEPVAAAHGCDAVPAAACLHDVPEDCPADPGARTSRRGSHTTSANASGRSSAR